MVESIATSVIDKALEAVLRKVGEGKKLSTEDLVVLMLGLFREIRKDITETNKRIDALYEMMSRNYEVLNSRINEVNDSLIKKIDEISNRLVEKIDETNKRIDAINDSLSKRIDALYDLLGKIYQTLIKQETTQKQ
jgi:methyl-accepting chemotaxis protein